MEDMLSIRDVMRILDLSRTRITVLLQQGRFPGSVKKETKIGSYWAVPREAVENFQRLPAGRKSKTKQRKAEDEALMQKVRGPLHDK